MQQFNQVIFCSQRAWALQLFLVPHGNPALNPMLLSRLSLSGLVQEESPDRLWERRGRDGGNVKAVCLSAGCG